MARSSKQTWDRTVPDEELLRVVRSGGDPECRRQAAVELICRYRDAVYLWCYRYTRDVERARDLAQDVLTAVWQKLDGFEGRSKFSTWIYSVARNRCIDASRSVSLWSDEGDVSEVEDPAPAPDVAFDQTQDEDWLLGTIRTVLEPDEQRAIWLRCVERMGIDEVTRIMGLQNASGARAVLQRARNKLRAALEARRRAQERMIGRRNVQ